MEHVAAAGGIHDLHGKGWNVLHLAAVLRIPTALLTGGHHAAGARLGQPADSGRRVTLAATRDGAPLTLVMTLKEMLR